MSTTTDAQVRPYGQRIVVKRLETDKTSGGIYLPDTAKNRSLLGEVMAIGPDCEWCKPGDAVFFGAYSGFEIDIEGQLKGCLLMNEEDLLGEVTYA